MPRNSFTLLTLVPVTIPLSVKANAGKPAEASNAEPSVTAQIATAAIRNTEPAPRRLNDLFDFSILSIADSSISFRGARSAAADHAQFHVKQSPQRRGEPNPNQTFTSDPQYIQRQTSEYSSIPQRWFPESNFLLLSRSSRRQEPFFTDRFFCPRHPALRGTQSSAISESEISASEESTTMKLYNVNLSNFATKSRLVIYEKGLNIEMVPIPGGGLKSAEYAKINPLGKTPALDADGLLIPESEVINEYLEDKYPTPALMPKSPEGRAKVRIITRFHDLYLEPPLRALFGQLNPKTRDQKLVGEKLADLKNRR